jgi:hypothetical protein
MKFKIMVFIAALSLTNIVTAAVVEYNDRASFEAALSSLTVTLLTFEGLGNQASLGTSVNFGDLNVSNAGNVYAINGGFGAPTGQIGDQNNYNTILTLQPGYLALGMDMGLLNNPGQINITLRDSSDNIVASGLRSVTNNDNLGLPGSTFYGWISNAEALSSLQLDSGGFPTIDNAVLGGGDVMVETAVQVPVLAPWTLMLLAVSILSIGLFGLRSRNNA